MANVLSLERRVNLDEINDSRAEQQRIIAELAQSVEANEQLQSRIERFLEGLRLSRHGSHIKSSIHQERAHHEVEFPHVVYVGMAPDGRCVAVLTDVAEGGYHRMVITSQEKNGYDSVEIARPIVYGGTEVGDPTIRVDYLTPNNQSPYVRSYHPELYKGTGDPQSPEDRDYVQVTDTPDGPRAVMHNGLTNENTPCVALAEVLAYPTERRRQLNGEMVLRCAGTDKIAA